MDANQNYDVSVFDAPAGQWTPVTASINCNGYAVQGSDDLYIRSDPANAATQKPMRSGNVEYLEPAAAALQSEAAFRVRFKVGTILFYVQPQGGADVTVTATFVF